MKKAIVPAIRTERLSIRQLTATDMSLYVSLFTDKKVMKFAGPTLEPKEARDKFRKLVAMEAQPERMFGVIIARDTRESIGLSSAYVTDAEQGRAQVGILLKSAAHTKRFGMEASIVLINRMFSMPNGMVKELVGDIAVGNTATEELAKSLGYKRTGKLPADEKYPARNIWTLTREVWWKV